MRRSCKDLRVVEMGTYITGPAAAMHLGDLGADVIKVERPGSGDPFRAFKGGLYSPHFQTYNRNKRSIALDTAKPDDRAVFHELIATADVFIQNFRPGVAEKLGAGEAELQRAQSRAWSTARSPASGTTRPLARPPRLRHGGAGGERLPAAVMPPTNPRVIGPALADAMTGHYAALGILAALYRAQQTGKGRRIDISMLEAMCHFNLDSFTHYFSRGRGDGAAQPAAGVAVLHLRMRRRKMAGDPHVLAAEVLGGARWRHRPPDLFDRSALRRPARPHRAPGRSHRVHGADLQDPYARRLVRPPARQRGAALAGLRFSDEALEDPQAQPPAAQGQRPPHPDDGEFTTVRAPLTSTARPTSTSCPAAPRRAWRGDQGGDRAAQGGVTRPAAQGATAGRRECAQRQGAAIAKRRIARQNRVYRD